MSEFSLPQQMLFASKTSSFKVKILIAAMLSFLADWLFFGYLPGISLAIFATMLAIGISISHWSVRSFKINLQAYAILLISILPVIEEFNYLSFAIAVIGMAIFSLLMTNTLKTLAALTWQPLSRLLAFGLFRLPDDWQRERKKSIQSAGVSKKPLDLKSWIVPMVFGSAFLLLFMTANPIIEQFLVRIFSIQIDWQTLIEYLKHILMWGFFLSASWAFLQPYKKYLPLQKDKQPEAVEVNEDEPRSTLFGEKAIFRSLILFNMMFAIHTLSDALYLWGDATLPDGLTYAQYAYRGTYALMAAALLAGGFVLAAMRPGGAGIKFGTIRLLVYVWIAQTIVMIISTIFRLELYVSFYALTYTRLAGFIWIGLVGIGLVTIVAQIFFKKSNAWLVRSNIISVAVTLYMCSLTNFDHVIADFNVSNSQEITGKGLRLDRVYLKKLYPHAIYAENKFFRLMAMKNPAYANKKALSAGLSKPANWRSWGYREWRLRDYLRNLRKRYAEDTAP